MTGLNAEIERLVLELMPQARSEAWKVYSGAPHALDLDDLTSLAYAGLMAAAVRWPAYCAERNFNPGCGQVPCADPENCGTRWFAAYCLRRIKGSMLDAMRSSDHMTRSMRSRAKAIAAAEAGSGSGLTEADLARRTGLTRRQVRDTLAQAAVRPVSFDAESHDVADSADTGSAVVVSEVLAAAVAQLAALDAETQVVLALRYHQELDFAQIARRLGASESHVAALHDAGVLRIHGVMFRAVTLAPVPSRPAGITGMTPAETAAALEFRAFCRTVLDGKRAMSPDITVSVFARYVRHACAARGGVSTALELKEHYAFSPELYVCYCGVAGEPGPDFPHRECAGKTATVPAGRFGWIWTQGRCPACGMTALSAAGRLVDARARPPSEHAVIS